MYTAFELHGQWISLNSVHFCRAGGVWHLARHMFDVLVVYTVHMKEYEACCTVSSVLILKAR